MTSLLALLSQQTPNLLTRKALIILGLQNDFNDPSGKLPVTTDLDYLKRISELVPEFREHGDIIWVRSEFEANRPIVDPVESGCSVVVGRSREGDGASTESDGQRSNQSPKSPKVEDKDSTSAASEAAEEKQRRDVNEEDEELFLSRLENREPCCVRDTWGAKWTDRIATLIKPSDMQVTKSYYSAFSSTSLLMTLRSKLITELYVCGNMTNISVYATAMDAARYGIKITLVEDCLGYRKRERHDRALRDLVEIMEAGVLNSSEVVEVLKNPPESDEEEDDPDQECASDETHVARSRPPATPNAATALEVDSDDSDEDDSDDDGAARVRPIRPLKEAQVPHQRLKDLQLADGVSGTIQNAQFAQHEYRGGADGERKDAASNSATISGSTGYEGVVCSNIDEGDAGEAACQSVTQQDESHRSLADSTASARSASRAEAPCITSPTEVEVPANDNTRGMLPGNQTRTTTTPPRQHLPLFGQDKEDESAGSSILHGFLDEKSAETIFDSLQHEIEWQHMYHQTGEVPRLVCSQATINEDGSTPIYRHPSDRILPSIPWTPHVNRVRLAAEAVLDHPLNHALIQLYRGGRDFISEHSDKTLDIAHHSSIVNVSFGAQRVMRFRTKRAPKPLPNDNSIETTTPPSSLLQRTTHRVPLPHNSLLCMSLATNARYLHAIVPDKRPRVELTPLETCHHGHRISLTFRHIATFLSADGTRIWGQGARGKSAETAGVVVSGDETESARLVGAFGVENQARGGLGWGDIYGGGSDVVNLRREAGGEG